MNGFNRWQLFLFPSEAVRDRAYFDPEFRCGGDCVGKHERGALNY
jgi:hypothetical protein